MDATMAIMAALLTVERIAGEPCDHGPTPHCPRELARAALAGTVPS